MASCEEYSTFLAITEQSCALKCSIICLHFLCPVGITSESAFLHTLLWEGKPSSRAFLATDKITVKVKDHNYSNSWYKCCHLLGGNQTTKRLIYLVIILQHINHKNFIAIVCIKPARSNTKFYYWIFPILTSPVSSTVLILRKCQRCFYATHKKRAACLRWAYVDCLRCYICGGHKWGWECAKLYKALLTGS